MATFKERLVSPKEVWLLLAVAALPIYSWSIYHFLERFTGWLYYLTVWEIAGIFAYTQAFALIESLLVVAGVVLMALVLPRRLLRADLVPMGAAVILLSTLWAILAQYNDQVLRELSLPILLLWAGIYLTTIIAAWFLLYRSRRVKQLIHSVAERVSVLLYLYLPLSFLGLLIVLLRNL
ncbi:MAG TPA: hypothetical protein VK879_13505 [Candidatus Sulfomarinibacteraceae bacterium]|nr:hypothetical protein [Candidatus Sulfomarinibacteraceae bacterium]